MSKTFILLMTVVVFIGILCTVVTIQGHYDVLYKIGEAIGGILLLPALLILVFLIGGGSIEYNPKSQHDECSQADEEEENFMVCPSCDTHFDEDDKFCSLDGTKLVEAEE